MYQVQIGKPRKEFGKLPELTSAFHEIIINTDLEIKSPKTADISVDATKRYSIHEINTAKVEYSHKQILHKEGGWPREVDYLDNEQTTRYRKKIEKDEEFIKAVVEMGEEVEQRVMINNALNIYEREVKDANLFIEYKMEQVMTFQDARNRPVQSVQYSIDYKQFIASYKDDTFTNAVIWNIENAVRPHLSLLCNSRSNCFQYNNKDQFQVLGGLSSGQLCLWDTRKGSNAVFTSSVDNSHKDECTGVCWLQSKLGNEIASTGLDGTILLWDSRKLDDPIEKIIVDPLKDGLLHGGRCIDFDLSVTTKFLVGTDSGLVLNCNRKGKTSSEKLGTSFSSLSGPVKVIQRSPFSNKNFISFSGQSIKLWSEDTKVPIWKYNGAFTAGCMSQSRASLFFAATGSGEIYPFDLSYSLTKPRAQQKVIVSNIGF